MDEARSAHRMSIRTTIRTAATLLIACGILIGVYPFAREAYSAHLQRKLQDEFSAAKQHADAKGAGTERGAMNRPSPVDGSGGDGSTALSTGQNPRPTAASGETSLGFARDKAHLRGPDEQFPLSRLYIPGIGLDAIVTEGYCSDDLRKGPVHYPGTGQPGDFANCVVTGHVNIFGSPFRNLRFLQPGQQVLFETPEQVNYYVVRETAVITAQELDDQIWADDAALTLITCQKRDGRRDRLIVKADVDIWAAAREAERQAMAARQEAERLAEAAIQAQLRAAIAEAEDARRRETEEADEGRDAAIRPGAAADANPHPFAGDGLIWTEDSMVKVMRSAAPGSGSSGALRISACRQEHEAGQIVINAGAQPLRRLTVQVGDLRSTSESGRAQSFDAKNVAVFFVGYVDAGGWRPDPLLGLESVDVPAGEAQPVWVEAYVPKGTTEGSYHGTITVAADGVSPVHVPIELRVFDFTIAHTPSLKLVMSLWPERIAQAYSYASRQADPAVFRRFARTMLDHKINPAQTGSAYLNVGVSRGGYVGLDFATTDSVLSSCISDGQQAFQVPVVTWMLSYPALAERLVAEYGEHLQAKGWLGRAFVGGWDSSASMTPVDAEAVIRMAKSAFPALRVVSTEAGDDQTADIWMPLAGPYTPPDRAAESELWWCASEGPWMPGASYLLDAPGIGHRVLPWACYRYGVGGIFYWAANAWPSSATASQAPGARYETRGVGGASSATAGVHTSWDVTGPGTGPGDGILLYPGPGGLPVSSIRLSLIRDGIEDYQYLAVLRGKGGSAAAAAEAVAPSLSQFTSEPDVLRDAREKVGRMIEEAG